MIKTRSVIRLDFIGVHEIWFTLLIWFDCEMERESSFRCRGSAWCSNRSSISSRDLFILLWINWGGTRRKREAGKGGKRCVGRMDIGIIFCYWFSLRMERDWGILCLDQPESKKQNQVQEQFWLPKKPPKIERQDRKKKKEEKKTQNWIGGDGGEERGQATGRSMNESIDLRKQKNKKEKKWTSGWWKVEWMFFLTIDQSENR